MFNFVSLSQFSSFDVTSSSPVYRMFFMGLTFVYGLLCILKPQKKLKTVSKKPMFFRPGHAVYECMIVNS